MVAAFSLDISAFLSLPCAFEVYLRRWSFLEGGTGKTKFTLLTYVRSEEDDPLGPTPLGIYLFYYILRDIFPCFLLLGHIVIKKWDFKPNAKAQVLAPTTINTKCGRLLSNGSNKLYQTYKKLMECHGADYAKSHPPKNATLAQWTGLIEGKWTNKDWLVNYLCVYYYYLIFTILCC